MATEIVMPRLSDTMEEGRIIKWLKKVGDHVQEGEPLLEVETDKADIEVEAFDTGTLLEITVDEGETVNVGEKIGLIGTGEEAKKVAKPEPEKEAETPKEEEIEEPTVEAAEAEVEEEEKKEEKEQKEVKEKRKQEEQEQQEDEKLVKEKVSKAPRQTEPSVAVHMEKREAIEKFVARRRPSKKPASPLARELAQKHGLELSEIQGTGPSGEIVKRDVEKAVAVQTEKPDKAAPKPAKKKEIKATPLAIVLAEKEGIDLDEVDGSGIDGRIREIDVKSYAARRCALRGEEYKELSLMRKTIARRMTESKQTIPHFYLTMAIDMGAALDVRKKLNEGKGKEEKISVNDIIVKAAALALEEAPEVNWSFSDDKIKINKSINIGIATATPDGLIVPVIFDANKKAVSEIAAEARDKAARAKNRKLKPDEYSNATFTVSNLGMFGIEEFSAIIDPGQSGSLAVGAVVSEPVAKDGEVKIRQAMRVTLSCDHRVVDGYTGTQYLVKLKAILEEAAQTIS